MSPFRHPARAVLAATVAALALPCSALATFPGHNGRIAFHATTATEGTQIFTVRPDGRDLHALTHVAGDAISVDWSPDGQRIAFEIDTEDSATVALMNADGGGVRTLPGIGLFNGDPSFTPDGERLVYGFFDGAHAGVASMRLDGSDPRLIQIPENREAPTAPPDGPRIGLTCQQVPDPPQTLCTTPAGGGPVTNLTPVTPTAEVGAKSDWSPDGTQLVFTDHADLPNPGDSANVATVAADGTGERMLTHLSGGEVNAFAGSYS